jgi:hypothetical protein
MVSPVRGPGPATSISFGRRATKYCMRIMSILKPRRNPHQFSATRQNPLRDTLPCMDGFTERNGVPTLT